MTDYTQNTNFTEKDGLTPGDINKKVKGSELDAEFSEISSAITTKANVASPQFTGTPRILNASLASSSADSAIPTTAHISTYYAKLASPALTGSPTAPTQTTGDNSTKIATTAYVKQEIDAIPAVDYASELTAGTVRAYLDGTTLYIYTED